MILQGLCGERDRAAAAATWCASDFCWDPHLLIVVHRDRGWKNLSRVWIASL